MGATRQHKGHLVEQYMRSHPNEPIGTREVAAAIGWSPNSAASALARMCKTTPQLRRVVRGVYTWDTATERREMLKMASPALLLLSVIHTDPRGAMLARDDESDELYVVTKFKM